MFAAEVAQTVSDELWVACRDGGRLEGTDAYVPARLAKLEVDRRANGLSTKDLADYDALTEWEAQLVRLEQG